MQSWRPESSEERNEGVINTSTLMLALGLHLAMFVGFWVFAAFHGLFDKKEEIIPIDLSVVVVENLDGNEDEPPPREKVPPPPPPPPPPKPRPPAPPPPKEPKALERIVTNIVKKVDKKQEKKNEKKKVEKQPKKTAEELREERIRKMRESATVVNTTTVIVKDRRKQPNGRTDRKTLTDAEIRKLLDAGYKPGSITRIAKSTLQRAYSLIQESMEEEWEKDKPPWTDTLKPVVIRLWFGGGGRIVKSVIEKSSGDIRADQTLKAAASRLGAIPALPPEFIKEFRNKGVPVRLTVKPN